MKKLCRFIKAKKLQANLQSRNYGNKYPKGLCLKVLPTLILQPSRPSATMLKTILIAIVPFCLLFTAKAQYRVGIKAGVNFTQVKNIKMAGRPTDKNIGYNAGLISQINFGKMFVFRPEILYSLKGFKYAQDSINYNAAMHLHYISVPLLFGFQPFPRFSLLAGPEFSFLARANSRYNKSNHNESRDFNNLDIGIDVGLSYHLKKGLGIEVRYNHGFEDLMTVSNAGSTQKKQGSNQVFQVGLFFIFAKE